MKINITIHKIVSFFSRKNIKNTINQVDQTVLELIHPRFITKDTDEKQTNTNNKKSLMFHMYSNENDTLFI